MSIKHKIVIKKDKSVFNDKTVSDDFQNWWRIQSYT